MHYPLRILEVVQSLEKGGRTKRFSDTISTLRSQNFIVIPLCFSRPKQWVEISDLQIMEKVDGINWRLVLQIRKIIKSNNINIIHAHCEFSQLYSSIAGFSCGIKTVATFHRSNLAKYQPSLVNKLIKLFVDQFISVSYDRLSLLTHNLNLPKSNCHVVHGGVCIKNQPSIESIKLARAALNIPNDQLMLLSIGHLGEIKGHQDTLKALSMDTEHKVENIHLYIAGDGTDSEKEKITELVKNLELTEKVTLLGQINNSFVWLEACDIFIQPSLEEAFGLVFIEAGAKSKPVIATAVGGIKEIIISNETGILVPPASPEDLLSALNTLINSRTLRLLYGENGYKRVAENFSLINMVNKYTKIFKKSVK